jgi:NAD(P)-dependent dehydrogenase (short-subunit alcohol dehydrogenase family)
MYVQEYDIAGVYCKSPSVFETQGQRRLDPLNPDHTGCGEGDGIFAIRANLADERDLERVVELALARFRRVDLLVNAAVHSRWGRVLESDQILREAELQFQLNAVVPLRLSVLVGRHFWRDRDRENRAFNRHIVNVSSTAGHIAYPESGQSVYAASKAALNMLTWHMSDEFRTLGVRVNAIAPNSFPGLLPTEDVARAIVNLDRGTCNGTIIALDPHPVPLNRIIPGQL